MCYSCYWYWYWLDKIFFLVLLLIMSCHMLVSHQCQRGKLLKVNDYIIICQWCQTCYLLVRHLPTDQCYFSWWLMKKTWKEGEKRPRKKVELHVVNKEYEITKTLPIMYLGSWNTSTLGLYFWPNFSMRGQFGL